MSVEEENKAVIRQFYTARALDVFQGSTEEGTLTGTVTALCPGF